MMAEKGASTRLTGESECGSGGSGCPKSASRGRSPAFGSVRSRRPRWQLAPTTWRRWPSRATRPTSTSPSSRHTSPAPQAPPRRTSRPPPPWQLPSAFQNQSWFPAVRNPPKPPRRSRTPRIQSQRTITMTRSSTCQTSSWTSANESAGSASPFYRGR